MITDVEIPKASSLDKLLKLMSNLVGPLVTKFTYENLLCIYMLEINK